MKFRGIVVHGRSGAENAYPFEGPDDLMSRSPVKVMRFFMEHVAEHKFIEHEDFEIYSALRSEDRSVVTVLGEFHYTKDSKSPFMCMISAA